MSTAGDERYAVNLLTGFLGSGKTSLLRRLLQAPELSDAAVLINEFGEVGLDHLLVERLDEEIVLLASGCLCCTIRGDLKQAMTGLLDKRRRGLVPAFSRLVIETTGLADPAPIVATLSADPMLCHQFRLGNIVTLVDAVSGLATLARHEESVKQAAVADRLVISKVDLASRADVAALRARLVQINPTAAISESTESAPAPAELLLHDLHDEKAKAGEVAHWLAGAGHDPDHHHAGDQDPAGGETLERNRHGDIRAFCLSAGQPLDWAAFGLWLSMLLNRHGTAILRVKGLLDIAGVDTPVVVHGVQHTIHPPVHLDRWPEGAARTRLVVIAKGLEPALVERSFRAFAALAA